MMKISQFWGGIGTHISVNMRKSVLLDTLCDIITGVWGLGGWAQGTVVWDLGSGLWDQRQKVKREGVVAMATYCISDIHGQLYEFMSLLGRIDFDAKRDVIYFLGDAVDRGKYPIDCLDYIRKAEGIHMLMGNHEKMMLDYYDGDDPDDNWHRNGCETTMKQLKRLKKAEREELFAYVRELPYYETVTVGGRQFFLSHAGLDATMSFSLQDDDDLIWSREEFYLYPALKKYVCIFGHTPTPHLNGDFTDCSIWLDTEHMDKINIDCGCVYGGALAALRLDDGEVFYVKSTIRSHKGTKFSYVQTPVPATFFDGDFDAYHKQRAMAQ
jgi:serine/threonine protein phosphatase 1